MELGLIEHHLVPTLESHRKEQLLQQHVEVVRLVLQFHQQFDREEVFQGQRSTHGVGEEVLIRRLEIELCELHSRQRHLAGDGLGSR